MSASDDGTVRVWSGTKGKKILTLRGHEAGDFDAFAAMLADPRMSYMGGPFDRDAAWSYFTNNISGWALHGFGIWTVTGRQGGHDAVRVAATSGKSIDSSGHETHDTSES